MYRTQSFHDYRDDVEELPSLLIMLDETGSGR
jgi:hypothetical protein